MTKVISFSLWGNDPKYCVGAIRNAELAASIYPDWVCRFYIAKDVPIETQGKLANLDNVDLYDMPLEYNGWKGMFSRFLPGIESEIDIMISRDCDSRLSLRERAAVYEWEKSDKGFHTMHDHPYHTVPILGGMWGMKRGAVRQFYDLMAAWEVEDRWQTDQDFLTEKIWPLVQYDHLNHDSFFRHIWGGWPFPTSRNNDEFVGQVFDENENTVPEHLEALRKAL